MVRRRHDARVRNLNQCHGGEGVLLCLEMLANYQQAEPGIKFYHDNTLQPGDSIGEHVHTKDEEIYIVLTGTGLMKVDGKDESVGPGDFCLTRRGHSHSLANTGSSPMHFLVIGVALA
jgi:uncharacterized cupin superfamily protein